MKQRDFDIAIILSVLLHLIFVGVLYFVGPLLQTSSDAAAPIEVFLQKPDGGWQIADINEPAVQQKPDKARLLGMYNQKADEETVALTKMGPRGSGGQKQGNKGSPQTKSESPTKQKTAQREKVSPQQKGKDINLYQFDRKIFASNKPQQKSDSMMISSGRGEGGLSEDFFPDFKVGGKTYVNVLRYPEVEYFVRLKRIFRMTWDPVSAIRSKPVNLSVSRGVVSCVLGVSVDKSGNMSELFVLKSSGIPVYDEEALRTIRASSPFASPPSKFLEKDGALHMSWTFALYI